MDVFHRAPAAVYAVVTVLFTTLDSHRYLHYLNTLLLYAVVTVFFTTLASHRYPHYLNTLLLMPLYKSHGNQTLCNNYQGISLIHPLGQ